MKDLSPYLEYFELLAAYVRQGYLEVFPATNEAFITRPALHALANTDLNADKGKIALSLFATAKYLRIYTQYLNASLEGFKLYKAAWDEAQDQHKPSFSGFAGKQADENCKKIRREVMRKSFALHVVKSQYPYDLLYTILLTSKRRWYWPFSKTTTCSVIAYG